ncbi:MAG: BON domain-containing protein [Caulobacteraceae bacterium]
MDDKLLRQTIIDALDWDPSIDSANIGVAVDQGVATLTGHVANYAQKIAAEKTVKRVKGVRGVAQDIRVDFGGPNPYSDDDIARRAVTAIDLDISVPKTAIQVAVQQGWVTLSGEVDWEFQRRAAEADVRKLQGVMGIGNRVTLKPRVVASDVSHRIEAALKRDAEIDASGVRVSVVDGRVRLDGEVNTYHDRDLAERAAWAAPGVKTVEDHIRVV